MQLTHLGAFYKPSHQTIATVETNTELCFMGRTFKMRTPKAMPIKTTSRCLTYRGVRYSA
ncbi:MAG: DUF4278 domain-containing protein [Cyanobacteria bacterium P01_B01_bin.77]